MCHYNAGQRNKILNAVTNVQYRSDFELKLLSHLFELFMCHHELWPTSVSRPFSSLKCSSDFTEQPCLINTLRPKQNARHFPDDSFQRISLNENVRILIQISLKFVPRGPIDNKPALVWVMAWRWTGDKPLPEPVLTQFTDAYMRH